MCSVKQTVWLSHLSYLLHQWFYEQKLSFLLLHWKQTDFLVCRREFCKFWTIQLRLSADLESVFPRQLRRWFGLPTDRLHQWQLVSSQFLLKCYIITATINIHVKHNKYCDLDIYIKVMKVPTVTQQLFQSNYLFFFLLLTLSTYHHVLMINWKLQSINV